MKKGLVCLLTLCLCFMYLPTAYAFDNKTELTLDAESVILIDATSGTVLYQKNPVQQEYPASITKIMTVYLALENGNLSDVLTASNTAIDNIDRSSTHIWLDYGEQLTLEDACYATLLQSANDTANVLAEAIGGTQEAFANKMTEKAIEIGTLNTSFTNAHGLPDESHYTTAYDMALITRVALENEEFKKMFETYSYTMTPTNKQSDSRVFATGNEMLKKGAYNYEYATGGKVGWTEDSGYTLVATAEKDGLSLIAVILKASSKAARYSDAKALFDYGFANYKEATITGSEEPQTYQIMKGKQVLADCTFTYDGQFKILLEQEDISDLLKVEYEIRNEDNPETIQCFAVLKMGNVTKGEVEMEKEVVVHDLSFKATVLPKIKNGFDFLCAMVCALFVGLFLVATSVRVVRKMKASS